jgi:hypothetical protein
MAALAKFFGKDTNPSKLNKDLIEKGGFNKDGDYTFFSKDINQPLGISLVYEDIKPTAYIETPNDVTVKQFAEIDAQLNKGFPVLVQVDAIPATSKLDQHWILLISKSNGNYIVYDPYYGDTADLTRYGKPAKTIYKIVFYEGKLPEKEEVVDWAAKYHVLDEQFTLYKTENAPFRALVEKIAIRLQSAPTEAEIFKAINEYEGYEEIASKLWKKAVEMTGKKELLYPDQIETMLNELDTVSNDAKLQRTRVVEASKPEKMSNVSETTEKCVETHLTALKRISKWVSDFFSNLPVRK